MDIGRKYGCFPLYSNDMKYKINDHCSYNGDIYVALIDNAGDPVLTTDWKKIGLDGPQGITGPQGIQGPTITTTLLQATHTATISLTSGAWRTVPIGGTYGCVINDSNSNFNSTPTSNKLVVAKSGTYYFDAVVFASGCPTLRILKNTTEIGKATFDYQYGRTSIVFSQQTSCIVGDTIEIQTYWSNASLVLLNSKASITRMQGTIGTYLQLRAVRIS